MDEAMYREQPSFQQQTQKQTNSIWPEKLGRKSHVEQQKSSNQNRKKIQQEDSDYSEEYTDSESQADNDEIVSTTTEAPKKVCFVDFVVFGHLLSDNTHILFYFIHRNFENIRRLKFKKRNLVKSHFTIN
jgi:hypothetical protein